MAEEQVQEVKKPEVQAKPAMSSEKLGATPGVPGAKPKWWIWAAVALAVIAVGAGVYFLFLK